jgi:hypothetical protein
MESATEIQTGLEIVSYTHGRAKETLGNKFSRDIREVCLHLITVRYRKRGTEAIESDSFVFYNGRLTPFEDGWPVSKRSVKKHLLKGNLLLWGDWGRFANLSSARAEDRLTSAQILRAVAVDLGLSPREAVNLFRHRLTAYEKNTSQENRVSCNLQVAQLFPDLEEECNRQNSGRDSSKSDPEGSATTIVRKRPLRGERLYAFTCSRFRQNGTTPIFAAGSPEQAAAYCSLLNSVNTTAGWWYKDLTASQPADFPGIDELDPPFLADLIAAWRKSPKHP